MSGQKLATLYELASALRGAAKINARAAILEKEETIASLLRLRNDMEILNKDAEKLALKNLLLKRRHKIGLMARLDDDIERRLRHGETPLKIPYFHEMKSKHWMRAGGPDLVRWLAKSYGILGPILPVEIESNHHVHLTYGNGAVTAHQGNLIIPSPNIWNAEISIRDVDASKFYSMLMVDVDVPLEDLQRRVSVCLWAQVNVRPSSAEILKFQSESEFEDDDPKSRLHSYIPPHPTRGSDTHRIIAVVFEHNSSMDWSRIFEMSSSGISSSNPLHQNRLMDLGSIVSTNPAVQVCGYQFHRMCWTKEIDNVYQKFNTEAPVFGENVSMESVQAEEQSA